AHDGARGDQLGVAVSLHDLGGHRLWLEPERPAYLDLQVRRNVREGTDGAGDLPNPDGFSGSDETLPVPPSLREPAGRLEAERGRLRVDAVGAPDRQRVSVAQGQPAEAVPETVHPHDQAVRGLDERQGQGRVHYVRGGEADVDEARVGADRTLEIREEREHVVVDPGLGVRNAPDGHLRPRTDPLHRYVGAQG